MFVQYLCVGSALRLACEADWEFSFRENLIHHILIPRAGLATLMRSRPSMTAIKLCASNW